MRTDSESLVASQILLGEMVYDRFVMGPALVVELLPGEITKHHDAVIDRRLPERHRVTPTDYDGTSYRPCWMHSAAWTYAYSLPVTEGCWDRWLELDRYLAMSDVVASTAQGYQLHARKKLLRLCEDRGPIIPHVIWRSVLLEYPNGRIRCVSFEFSNIAKPTSVEASIVSTTALEARIGFGLWEGILDENFAKEKGKAQSRWW